MKSLFNWRVLLNLVLAIGVFVLLGWLTFRWLEAYTNHGDEVAVPNVMNTTVHRAVQALDEAGLEYEVDSLKYDPKYKPFQVLGVFPRPGAKVKTGRSITLLINPRTWAPVSVPDILDKYKGLAFRRLEQVGLKMGDTLYEPNIQRDAIIRILYNGREIRPGTQLPRFSTIALVIGTGPKRNISVPDVSGMTLAEARTIIAQSLFEVGLVENDMGTQDENARVYFQDPQPGALRDQGMQIDLWTSKRSAAQLSAKISELRNTYWMQIDTTLPPVRYEEIPTYETPMPEPEEPVAVPRRIETPKPVAEKPAATPKPAPKPAPKKTETRPKTTTPAPAREKPSAPPVEKPKTKVTIE